MLVSTTTLSDDGMEFTREEWFAEDPDRPDDALKGKKFQFCSFRKVESG